MAFTYVKGSTANRDRVRLEIGDVDANRALFEDAELDDFLAQDTSVLLAAAHACDTLAVRFARDYSFSADGASFHKGDVGAHFTAQARRLRNLANASHVMMPQRKDGYSDDIRSDEVDVIGSSTFDSGRFSTKDGSLL